MINSIADYAIHMLDLEGFVTSWNIGAEQITGYRASEIIGQHFSRFFTGEDISERVPQRILSEARANGRHETAGWRLRRGGSRFWASAVLQLIHDDSGVAFGFAMITRDITERVSAQRALLESERRFRVLMEGVVEYAIYMLDASGIITSWNTGAERLKGYTAEQIIGQHFSKFYTREDRASGLPVRVLETAAREGRYEAEGWRVRKDGSRFWATVVVDAIRNGEGALEGFAKVTRDITERRAAQEALRESERQFRLLVAGVIDYALFMLDPNGIVCSWNAGAQRIKGYSAEEIIGQHFSRFYTERDRAAGLPTRALGTAMQEGRFEAEGWRVRKDGTLFWANVVIDAIRDESDALIGFAKITRDITARRAAENALQEAQAQRAHAQKMDALGQLTGGVAHDFNNLLMVITGHLTSIRRKVADDPKASRALDAIERATLRGEALTRQLLTFARRQAFNPIALRPGESIEAFRGMLASSVGSSVDLHIDIGPETWPIRVDADELELAIVNLVLNARDAMPEGGTIAVTAKNVSLAPADMSAGLEGNFVALYVRDTGTGIAPDVLAKVFDPFFTTKQAMKGSGLGLSQVHGFAHQSGGTVTIDSALGKGTTVTLYFPRADEAPELNTPEKPVESAPGSGTVMLVEDNPDVAEATASLLEQLGYQVHAFSDAEAALGALDSREFDLAITDIVMAGSMDGIGIARAIRQRKPDLPVLLVTGYSSAAEEAGKEFPLLRKPLHLAQVSQVAARLIAEANQSPDANVVRLHGTRPQRPSR